MLHLENPLTTYRADNRYVKIILPVSVELQDNHSEYITIGNSSEETIILEYEFVLPIGNRKISGKIKIMIESNLSHLLHEYDFVKPEIKSLEYFSDVNGTDVRLRIVTNNIGENPIFVYKKQVV